MNKKIIFGAIGVFAIGTIGGFLLSQSGNNDTFDASIQTDFSNTEENQQLVDDTEIEIPDIILPSIVDDSIIETKNISEKLYDNDTLLVNYSINIPSPNENAPSETLENINVYYDNIYAKVMNILQDEIFDNALAGYNSNPENFLEYTYYADFDIFLETDEILSIKRDEVKFYGGSREVLTTYAEVFRKSDGARVLLSDIVTNNQVLIDYINKIIAEEVENGAEYYPNIETTVSEIFDSTKFYLSDASLIVFFDMYDLAPGSTFISQFHIPYVDISDYLTESYNFLGAPNVAQK